MSFLNTLEGLVNQKIIDNSDFNSEAAFTDLCFDMISDTMSLSDLHHSYYYSDEDNNQNFKINGFSLSEDLEVLSLFVTDLNTFTTPENIDIKDVTFIFKQLNRVLNYVIRTNDQELPKSHILTELHSQYVLEIKKSLTQIHFYFI